jgi:acyl-CoA thioesterase-1
MMFSMDPCTLRLSLRPFLRSAFAPRGHRSRIALALALVNLALPTLAAEPDARLQSPLRITVLGDSLTAGYGLPAGQTFPEQLQRALHAAGFDLVVENAGVSGDTTAGGLARLDWALALHPDIAIVELGANDALRGLSPEAAEANLDRILTRLGERGVVTLLAGMRAPQNLGEPYVSAFNGIYPRLAERHEVALYPFFLQGVAGVTALNQSDGIHPNPRGVKAIVRGILPALTPLVEAALRDRAR